MASAGPEPAFPIDLSLAENAIFDLVSTSDLSKLTSANVRVHLKEKFGVDFEGFKKKINEMTRESIEKNQKKNKKTPKKEAESGSDSDSENENENENEEEEKVVVKQENGETSSKAGASSDSDSDDGVIDSGRKLKGKKASKKADSSEFDDIASNIKTTRRAAASKASQEIKKNARFESSSKKRKAEEKEGEEKIAGKVGPKTQLAYCSEQLQEITGKAYMKRCDIVKCLWDYIKLHNLQDPKNKKRVKCNEQLEALFKKPSVQAFGMMKYLNKHIMSPRDIGPEYEKEAQEVLAEMIVDYRRRVEEAKYNGKSGEPEIKKAKEEEEDRDAEEKLVKEEEEEESDSDSD
ncbi:unnamed protein product [Caenorhabditis angaria]|uniref:DM2 domain-containing protein n=1 Tax=Caenorhabditis angaria TaxID=860376 RepID=A0A9P1IE67_9PELO|nr:unnamed protein product [Caenorhabditis angaria]